MRNSYSAAGDAINYISVIPFLYRYEDQNYIDTFFENGDLFISSFHNYKKYKDNELGDSDEGTSMNNLNLGNNLVMTSVVSTGMNDYSFCTSTNLDKNLLKTFSRTGVFRIKDPLNFMIEVTRSLQRVRQVVHGHCLYVDDRVLNKNIQGNGLDFFKSENGGISGEKLMAANSYVQGFDSLFLKLKNYQHQSEYRILWQTDREVKEGVVINCPEAIQYCEQVEI